MIADPRELTRAPQSGAPKFTIITAAWNSAGTIRRTLDSVAAQSWPNVEHLIIDGASPDGTAAIARAYPHVAHVLSEPDRGVYDAMNKGLRLASGDIIAFLNADDHYAHADVLARVAELLKPEDDAVFADVSFFKPEQPTIPVRRYSSRFFRPDQIGFGWMPAHPSLFARRRVYDTVGHFKTDYRVAADFEWIARAFGVNGVQYRYVPEVWVHMQPGGISTRWQNLLVLNREVKRACEENGIYTNWLRLVLKYRRKVLGYLQT
jgi:glycosyltransferase involved in cell wall biosynthesis